MRRAHRLAIAVALSLAACARPSKPARPVTGALPAAPGVVRTAGIMTASDGLVLFEQCWRPSPGQPSRPRAVVVIVHGIKDHSSRYDAFATGLARAGYAACGFDHRGHGRSAGPRFAIDSFARVLDDLDQYLALTRARFPGAPLILFGHSMGGVMVPLYLLDRRPALAGIVVSSSALRPYIHPFEIAGLRLVATLLPNAPLLDAPTEDFSPDPAVLRAMRADPFIDQGRGTGRMALELAGGIERVWARASSIQTPILILHGIADRATDPHGSVDLYQRVGSTDRTLRLYPGGGHDLAHDPVRHLVLRDLVAWLARVVR
jgi:alpha-beta hydrolase superfamily lysophospholipase